LGPQPKRGLSSAVRFTWVTADVSESPAEHRIARAAAADGACGCDSNGGA